MKKTIEFDLDSVPHYERENAERLLNYINSDDEYACMWDVFGIHCGGYDQDVDEDLIHIIEQLLDKKLPYFDGCKFAGKNSTHVALILYILCSCGIAEYGTSPRSAFINSDLEPLIRAALGRWKEAWSDESH